MSDPISAIIGIGGQAIANSQNKKAATKAFDRSLEIQKRQQKNQKKLNVQGQELGMKTWNDTNYGAQMKHLKDAGLNAGLMYGMSGGGGATAGSPSGGGAGGAAAPVAPQFGIEGINSAAMLSSQIKLNEASANKMNTEADKIGGVDTAEGQGRIGLQGVEAKLKGLQGAKLEEETKKLMSEGRSAIVNAEVDEETKNTRIQTLKQELLGVNLDNALKTVGINKTVEETKAISAAVAQKWKDLVIKQGQLDQSERANNINKWKEEVKAMYPAIWNTAGHAMENVLNSFENWFGDEPVKRHKMKEK